MRDDPSRQGRFFSLWVHLWVTGEIDMSVRKRWMFILGFSCFSCQLEPVAAHYTHTRPEAAVMEQSAAISHAAAEGQKRQDYAIGRRSCVAVGRASSRWSQLSVQRSGSGSHDDKKKEEKEQDGKSLAADAEGLQRGWKGRIGGKMKWGEENGRKYEGVPDREAGV
ncbi:hypothetical protein M440DRAFT_1166910 [Trichoderma longibrachiatum ATCC 18648]|uniref:Uncharacterized protein n=1 Tax=Trichoderma longibrachiatum ATCC 18648 TaxID=983965 RepID=A0A2T4CCP8_TRILO|nr:hypothetical protein M440DRAFT_1166910 [Trichoderma longibrachiatum ATCC 18648]